MYHDSSEVIIPKDSKQVHIVNTDPSIVKEEDKVIAKYELVRKDPPMWTDDTKCTQEIMVKLQVRELSKDDGEKTWDDVSSGQAGGKDESPEHFTSKIHWRNSK